LHKTEEAEHGLWALNDYLALGGDKEHARNCPPDPSTFAVASVWWRMAQVEDPWAYLGAEYLFEYLTVKVAQPMVEIFNKRGMSGGGLHFIIEHASEDVKHAILIRTLIIEVVEKFPEAEKAMLRGFDYFQHVYPLPVWEAAYLRAT
jgi:pyrroloquinoline quinone (PQQ) biosynthesis protein C